MPYNIPRLIIPTAVPWAITLNCVRNTEGDTVRVFHLYIPIPQIVEKPTKPIK